MLDVNDSIVKELETDILYGFKVDSMLSILIDSIL